MTIEAFIDVIKTQGNCFYFDLHDKRYCIGYIPVPDGHNGFTFSEIGIYEEQKETETLPEYFETVEDMLNKFVINKKTLLQLLPDIKNMQGIPSEYN